MGFLAAFSRRAIKAGVQMIVSMIRVFFRSFFLQTLWNFERMQNIGFAFSILPLLERACPVSKVRQAALRRHVQFFNVHPYFAPIVMGVVYAKEAGRSGQAGDDPTITVLKDSMGAAFGGIGDHVLWGTWRPFCALVALAVGLLVAYPVTGAAGRSIFEASAARVCAQWWIAGFLAIFNSAHLWLRWRGLQKAVSDGPLVVRWVQSLHLQSWAAQIRRLGLFLLVIMIMAYLARWNSAKLLLWMVAVLLGTVLVKRWAFSGFTIFYLVCAVSIAMAKFSAIPWP